MLGRHVPPQSLMLAVLNAMRRPNGVVVGKQSSAPAAARRQLKVEPAGATSP